MSLRVSLRPRDCSTHPHHTGNFIIQYIGYISVLDNNNKRQYLVDLATLIVWTVAVSYTIVLLVSRSALDRLYNIYGFWPFWLGNFVIHYLPAIINTAAVRSPYQSLAERAGVFLALTSLIVLYNLTHDTSKVYFSDIIDPMAGMGYMIAAAFVLQVGVGSNALFLFLSHLTPQLRKFVTLDWKPYICTGLTLFSPSYLPEAPPEEKSTRRNDEESV